MKIFLMVICLFQFTLTGFISAQGNFSDINNFSDTWKLSNLELINKMIQSHEKKKSLNTKEEIELVLLYANYSYLSKKLPITKKYATLAEKLYKKYPQNPIAIGNYANSILSLARDDNSLQDLAKMEVFNKGMKIYDNALEGAYSNSFYLRFLRGITCLKVPSILGKIKVAKTDYEWMVQSYEKAKANNQFIETNESANDIAGLYYGLGVIHQRLGDMQAAKETFKKSVQISPNGKWGKEAKQALDILE